jgi:hypothetical protein
MPRVIAGSRLPAALLALSCATLALGGCATRPRIGPPSAAIPVPTTGPVPEVAALRLTVYPTPRQAEYGTFLLPLGEHRRVDVTSDDFLETLDELELVETWRELPDEGYVLQVGWHDDRTLIVLAAADEAGARWGEEALLQLTARHEDGSRWVRDCLVIDAPGFPLRGNKRPQAWEEAYRANFAWGARRKDAWARRHVVPFHAPGSPFDATAAGVAAALEAFGPWQRAGVRRFAIKFDDVGFGLTSRSQLAYGAYARAVVVYLNTVREALTSVDPAARLYYLPQTYWWHDERLETFSAALRASGGLAPDIGLVLTGPEVISETIDAAGLATARATFGATETKALLYDNLGREGDWGPLTGRDAGLVELADAVFGERGTPVNRLTRLDWAWNPTSYDPERSWRRAVLELAGPAGYEALRDACAAFRARSSPVEIAAAVDAFEGTDLGSHAGPLPQAEIVRLLRADLRRVAGGEAAP